MKSKILIYLLGFVVLAGCTKTLRNEEGDIVMFTEASNDWEVIQYANWSQSDDELIGRSDSIGGFVITKDMYTDFELTLEFFPDSTINSGVYIRCGGENINPAGCYELNIWDNHPYQENRTGAVVLKAPPKSYVETIGKWNTYKILCKENRLKAWVNDSLTVDYEGDSFLSGKVALQAAGKGTVRFRNVILKEM